MAMYMDIHKGVKGLTVEAVAAAHKMDLETQEKHGVKFLNYWYNREDGTIFCLTDAPSKEAANAVHRDGHGMVADEIIEVEVGE